MRTDSYIMGSSPADINRVSQRHLPCKPLHSHITFSIVRKVISDYELTIHIWRPFDIGFGVLVGIDKE